MVLSLLRSFVSIAAILSAASGACAADGNPCAQFTWDVAIWNAVTKRPPPQVSAASAATVAPVLEVGRLYELKLPLQGGVTFAAPPGRATSPENASGGLAKLRVAKSGRYRVAIGSGHWIDIVDDGSVVKSGDFQMARGCQRPRKIVEFELTADRDLIVQLSGATAEAVLILVAPASAD